MFIDSKEDIANLLGYTGFSMLVGQNVPFILHALEPYVESLNIDIDKSALSSMCVNVVSGVLILAYGVLADASPIYIPIPGFIFVNLVGICLKCCKGRSARLY
jgi:hypothetical protein